MDVSTSVWSGPAVRVLRERGQYYLSGDQHVRLYVRLANGENELWYWDLRTPYLALRPKFA